MSERKERPPQEDLDFYADRCVGEYLLVYLFMNSNEHRYAEWFDLTPLYFDDRSDYQNRMYTGLTEADLMASLITGELSTTEITLL